MNALQQLGKDFLKLRQDLCFSHYTVYNNDRTVVRFLAWLESHEGVTTSGRLRARHFRDYRRHLRELTSERGAPMKPGSINVHIRGLRGFAGFLAREGHISPRIADGIAYLKEPQTLPTSVLEHGQVRKLLRSIDTTTPNGYRDRTIMELMYSTGIRRMEVVGLDLDDIDLKNALMKVLGKYSKERVVPIGRTALRYLTSYINAIRPLWHRQNHTRAVFLNRFGERLHCQGLGAIFRLRRSDAGIDVQITPHTLRRSCITEMVRADANLYHVKELLGHESLETLHPYTKLTINDLKKTHAKCHPRERDEKRDRGA